MKKFLKIGTLANNAACALFNYGWVVITGIIEACVLTETAYNIAMAETIQWGIAGAGLILNALTLALFIGAIKELRAAKNN